MSTKYLYGKTTRYLRCNGYAIDLWCCRGNTAHNEQGEFNAYARLWRHETEKEVIFPGCIGCRVCGAVYLTKTQLEGLEVMYRTLDLDKITGHEEGKAYLQISLAVLDLLREQTPRLICVQVAKHVYRKQEEKGWDSSKGQMVVKSVEYHRWQERTEYHYLYPKRKKKRDVKGKLDPSTSAVQPREAPQDANP